MMKNDLLFEEVLGKGGDLGLITLNRPNALNSLNHDMIVALFAQLKKWATAKNIKAVVIRAADGRAFCAGGDIRLTYERHQKKDPKLADFFRDEYQLNRFIFHFPKPYIALLDGITMGGGVGISIHGSHRVATERLLFAMPETGIGFFPDVGGTYFLPRLPKKMGYYLGLAGARLSCDDCVYLNIATQKVSRDSLLDLIDALARQPFSDHAKESVTQIMGQFTLPIQSQLVKHQSEIEKCFSAKTIENILQLLHTSSDAFCNEAAKAIDKKSPTSLKITLRALQEGEHMDFDACMKQEFRLTSHFLQGHDFFEGIRAVVIDKDQAPKWKPSTLLEVTNGEVENYFSPLAEELV